MAANTTAFPEQLTDTRDLGESPSQGGVGIPDSTVRGEQNVKVNEYRHLILDC